MITFQVFMLGVLATSIFTGLATEAIKKVLVEHKKNYYANTLAGIVSLILSLAIGAGYILITDIGFTTHTLVYLIALVFISWLCAMVGYDKVVQAIGQFKTTSAESKSDEL